MFVIKICHSYEQFYITVTKKKLSYEMHQYDKQCLLLLQNFFISVDPPPTVYQYTKFHNLPT